MRPSQADKPARKVLEVSTGRLTCLDWAIVGPNYQAAPIINQLIPIIETDKRRIACSGKWASKMKQLKI